MVVYCNKKLILTQGKWDYMLIGYLGFHIDFETKIILITILLVSKIENNALL